jgi:hypothetical protein
MEMYVTSVRQEVPTGRENRFQRFSYSGTYRVTHRRMVLWATMTPQMHRSRPFSRPHYAAGWPATDRMQGVKAVLGSQAAIAG